MLGPKTDRSVSELVDTEVKLAGVELSQPEASEVAGTGVDVEVKPDDSEVARSGVDDKRGEGWEPSTGNLLNDYVRVVCLLNLMKLHHLADEG